MLKLRVATLYPLLSVAQGDEANADALAARAARRGLDVESATVNGDERVPAADIYLLGGSGSKSTAEIAKKLADPPVLARRLRDGAAVLAVDAGLDVIGNGFGAAARGLGLLDIRSFTGPVRSGAVVTTAGNGLPALIGWESHSVRIEPGPGVAPFARLEVGHGDGDEAGFRTDGAIGNRIIGTRLHGPILGRNPEVADLLLAWAIGKEPASWEPLPEGAAEASRAERIREEREAASAAGIAGKLVAIRSRLTRPR